MAELNEQIHIEDHTMGVEDDEEMPAPPPQASILEAFQHYACLYIKYLQIFERLEECYDQMVHPQKRIDVKQVLEIVMARVVELKHDLVKWNPPNPSIQTKPERNFPWEYVNLDDILVDLKLPPETLEVPVPHYFLEDQGNVLKKRDRLIKGYMKLKLGIETLYTKTNEQQCESFVDVLSMDEAIQLIQRNERGRQGRQRGKLIKEVREEEKQRRMYDATTCASDIDPEIAASNIQRHFRGFKSRNAAIAERDDELVFIGMKPAKSNTRALEKQLQAAKIKRKTEQMENIEGYAHALIELKETVKEEEGPFMREKMMEERREWFTQVMSSGKFPQDLDGFYAKINPPAEEKQSPEGAAADSKAADPKKKDKDKKSSVDEILPEQPPQLTGPTELTTSMLSTVDQYDQVWLDRDESNNFHQKHDVELAKDVVRTPVEAEIRQQVDETLILQLANIKAQLEAAASSGKKGKKGGGKKGGKSKGKKGKKDKKSKGKKGKALPGDRIAELKGRSVDTMLAILVEQQIVFTPQDCHVSDLIGDFNYLGTVHQSADRKTGTWVPQNPSAAQIRQNVTEYAILPLGSVFVRTRTKLIRSILFYGAQGSGKTLMANAIAKETGALFLNLSAENLMGKFPGKNGPTKLVHMAFAMAKDPAMQPVVIYIDECDQIFASGGSGKKKVASDGPGRFRKDLITYLGSLTPEDRVVVIGCTKQPENGDLKDLKSFFDKMLFFPYPDYASRVMLWKRLIQTTMEARAETLGITSGLQNSPDDFDIGTLAHISEGYSSGSIAKAIDETLTKRRVERMDKRPLSEDEFLGPLSRNPRTYRDDHEKFSKFTSAVTGLEKRIGMIRDLNDPNKAEGGDKKKKGKKKG